MATHSINLPLPRLQIRWEPIEPPDGDGHNWRAVYEMCLPVDRYDSRNDDAKSGVFVVKMGETLCRTGRPKKPFEPDGEVQLPCREGSHIAWDAWNLRLPAFAVYGDKATAVRPSKPTADVW